MGFNKTGTTTLHATAYSAGMRSIHSPIWPSWSRKKEWHRFSEYDFFCDGECADFRALDKQFPAHFILNTRPLKEWLLSRFNHVERNREELERGVDKKWVDHSTPRVKEWIRDRMSYHHSVIEYFSARANFSVLDFSMQSQEEIIEILSHACDRKIKRIRKRRIQRYDWRYRKKVPEIDFALNEMGLGQVSSFTSSIL